MEQQRLDRMLWPKAAVSSLYTSMSVLARLQWHKAKQTLGIQSKSSKDEEFLLRHWRAMQRMQDKHSGRPGSSPPGVTPDLAAQQQSANNSDAPEQSSAKAASAGTGAAGHATDSPNPASNFPTLPSTAFPSEIPFALHMFHHSMRHQKRSKLEPPKGTCVVSGLVEVNGPRARATLDVQALYHVQHARFEVVQAGVRSYKLARQPPMGGP
jgi:hypothetical protein